MHDLIPDPFLLNLSIKSQRDEITAAQRQVTADFGEHCLHMLEIPKPHDLQDDELIQYLRDKAHRTRKRITQEEFAEADPLTFSQFTSAVITDVITQPTPTKHPKQRWCSVGAIGTEYVGWRIDSTGRAIAVITPIYEADTVMLPDLHIAKEALGRLPLRIHDSLPTEQHELHRLTRQFDRDLLNEHRNGHTKIHRS